MTCRTLLVLAIMASTLLGSSLSDEIDCSEDPNSTIGCKGYCGKQCRDYINNTTTAVHPRVLCVHACIPGCTCIEGFYFDTTVRKCVLPDQCDPSNASD